MIEVTGIDLKQFAKDVYSLSIPKGMGFLHFRSGELEDEIAKQLVYHESLYPLDLDYVNGRACKMTVVKKEDKLFIDDVWFDHTDNQLKELLLRHNIQIEKTHDHACSCECDNCKSIKLKKKGE